MSIRLVGISTETRRVSSLTALDWQYAFSHDVCITVLYLKIIRVQNATIGIAGYFFVTVQCMVPLLFFQ